MLPVSSEVGGVSANEGVALSAPQAQAAKRASSSSGSCLLKRKTIMPHTSVNNKLSVASVQKRME
jgi:hypothetical protein